MNGEGLIRFVKFTALMLLLKVASDNPKSDATLRFLPK
jgi:hypothetical protein